jgi:hypothetical protein
LHLFWASVTPFSPAAAAGLEFPPRLLWPGVAAKLTGADRVSSSVTRAMPAGLSAAQLAARADQLCRYFGALLGAPAARGHPAVAELLGRPALHPHEHEVARSSARYFGSDYTIQPLVELYGGAKGLVMW